MKRITKNVLADLLEDLITTPNTTITLTVGDLNPVSAQHLINAIEHIDDHAGLRTLVWEPLDDQLPKDLSESIDEQIKISEINHAIEEYTPSLTKTINILRKDFDSQEELAYAVMNTMLNDEQAANLLHWLTFNTNLNSEEIAKTVLTEYYKDL